MYCIELRKPRASKPFARVIMYDLSSAQVHMSDLLEANPGALGVIVPA